jgi:hypothetical protein
MLRHGPVVLWAAALCALLFWPLTRSGYLLGHDLVFTPHQPLDLASIGLSSASPRAVPLDALVALAERAVDGAAIGRIALVLPVLAAGVGMATLLGSLHLAARLAACTVAVWNPFVIERLAIGQWALLWSYAALPWLIAALARRRSLPLAVLAVAAASITPSGGIVATIVAITVATGVRCRSRDVLVLAGSAVVLQLPWLVPAMVSSASATSDSAAVAAFAARGEFAGGPLLTLLGGGGIWNADVVPPSRGGALPWLGLVLLGVAAVFGARRLRVLIGARLTATLFVLSAVGLIVAIASSVPGVDGIVRAAVEHVPGAGLLRDAQKWVMPLVLLEALLVGAAVDRLADRVRSANWSAVLVVAAVTVPVLLLPDGAAPVHTTVRPMHFPPDWSRVVALARGGDAAVLPFASYRTFPWAPGRWSSLDPAPRLLQVPVVVSDRLAVSGRLLRGEDPRAAAVATALRSGTELSSRLADLGIEWVVVENDTPGSTPSLVGLHLRYRGPAVSLYRVAFAADPPHVAPMKIAVVIVADALAALLVLIAAAASAAVGIRHARSR